MQLREIHIDGFGIFHDRHITGLSSGIHVIYGGNEFGKTTLLEFVRRILFGFPSRPTNPYPALEGGAYGGRLVCHISNGKKVIISRKQGPRGGPVRISVDSTESTDQNLLNNILGNIGAGFYQNVYAISLDELGREDFLEKDEDVKSHIYGAGLGLGNISLKGTRDEFTDRAEKIFKSAGRTQIIPELYKDILGLEGDIGEEKVDLSKYDELVGQRDELMNTVDLLNGQIRDLETDKRKLENQKNLSPTYDTLSDAESKLVKLEVVPFFTEDALSALETLKGKFNTSNENIEIETEDIEDLEFQRDQLVYDENIVKIEPFIEYLWAESAKFESSSNDIKELRPQMTELVQGIEAKITKIGPEWTEESISSFDLNLSQEDVIRTFKQNLQQADDDIKKIKAKQESRRETKAAETSKGFAVPALLKYWVYPVTALALICSFWAFSASQVALTLLSFIVFGTGIALAIYIHMGKARDTTLPDQLEKQYNEELSIAEAHSHGLWGEWREFLVSINFDESLSPDGALEGVRYIKEIKSKIETRNGLDTRIQEMQDHIDRVKKEHDKVAACSAKSKITEDMSTNIRTFWRLLSEAKETKGKKEELIRQIGRQNNKIEVLKEKTRQAEEELQSYISSLGAKDENDFRLKYQTFTDRKRLKEVIATSIKSIQPTVGMGEHYDSFIQSISATTSDKIESELESITSRLKSLEGKPDEANRTIGELRTKINKLSSSDDILVKQSELEVKIQQLRDHVTEWAKAQIALFVLDKAISKYETTKQPKVIKTAQAIFAGITQAYHTIIVPAGTDDFTIRDSSGKSKTVKEMSKGTKEQLYFAMRLGLISVYEAEKEPMPIIMDDILVNFDDDRGPLAIKELAKFAKDRQVIILTCHKNTLDIYKSLDAKEITFS